MKFAFLGREFLTWLWFEAEHNSSRIETPQFGPVTVEFGQRLVLTSGGNVPEGSTVQQLFQQVLFQPQFLPRRSPQGLQIGKTGSRVPARAQHCRGPPRPR